MVQTKYGVISDVHHDPRVVPVAIDVLKSLGIEKLLVNGDIGEPQKTLKDSQNYTASILDSIGKSGLESYVQPGSHETYGAYMPVVEYFSDRYSNIIDAIKIPKVEFNDHHLVFLPGSDWNTPHGEFTIGNNEELQTGEYVKMGENLIPLEFFDNTKLLQLVRSNGVLHYQNMGDLRNIVTDPDKTIVVCHVPRRFGNIDKCVDMAYFAEKVDGAKVDGAVMPGIFVEQGIRSKFGNVPYETVEQIAKQNGLTLKRENRGNNQLRDLYEELGVRKSVTAHFHESGHRANDLEGKHVEEDTLVDELFWNSGHLDVGQTGVLTVDDSKVSYHNVRLQDYVK